MFNLKMNTGSEMLYFRKLIPATKRQSAVAVYAFSPEKAARFRSCQEASMTLSALTSEFHTYRIGSFSVEPVIGNKDGKTAIPA